MYKYGINACMVVVLSINEIDLNITNLPKTSKKKINACIYAGFKRVRHHPVHFLMRSTHTASIKLSTKKSKKLIKQEEEEEEEEKWLEGRCLWRWW